ncbi:MAG: 23S rRNA pseudouridine(955/2504/2580) synthase [Oleiphilus sp.]|nr:MAG: 23S rRNA pseudouridine(955/2504/2580) synthase [Oleiphilus sp.]
MTKESFASSPRPQVQVVEITEKNATQRVDNFLITALKGVPKSKIYRVIRKGEVRINKKRCKPETKLQVGDMVRIPPVFREENAHKKLFVSDELHRQLDAAILFENKGLLAINKPSGLAVHGGSGVQLGLIEALRTRYSENQFLELVHRLDRDTSGCILIAKSRPVLTDLHRQFREDRVNKYYHLAVFGRWPRHRQAVDAPLRKNELKSGERMVFVAQDGKPSQTEFRILSNTKEFSFLEAKPITGRTHQIRVHAAFSGHPIVGDRKYLQKSTPEQQGMDKCRLMLHARTLEFSLPDGEPMQIEAEYDPAFSKALQRMGLS